MMAITPTPSSFLVHMFAHRDAKVCAIRAAVLLVLIIGDLGYFPSENVSDREVE